ncbi:Uncharacterised protein [Mycobacteroides abscessus subsp. abscessus]|nr:Uncharacterised protein [Mycobacteroides abscessus subsp. abscessus]
MLGSENLALPQLMSSRVPSSATSTGLLGSDRVISESNRPDTSALPAAATSAGTFTCADTS